MRTAIHRKVFVWAAGIVLMGHGTALGAHLNWAEVNETDLEGYAIYYGTEPGEYDVRIDVGNVCEYTVPDLEDGDYYFSITSYDAWGNESEFSAEIPYTRQTTGVWSSTQGPADFTLSQNYPNPFNPATNISFTVDRRGVTRLTVYNMQGQVVRVLFDGDPVPGVEQAVAWDGTNEFGIQVSSGVYFYRLQQDSRVETRRMQLIR